MGKKNTLADLKDHLFMQIERLNDDDLKGDDLKQEIERSKAMSQVATQIVNGAKITVDAMKLVKNGHLEKEDVSRLLGEG